MAPEMHREGGDEDSFRNDQGLDHVGPCKPSAYLELYFKSQGEEKMNKTLGFCGDRGIENYIEYNMRDILFF